MQINNVQVIFFILRRYFNQFGQLFDRFLSVAVFFHLLVTYFHTVNIILSQNGVIRINLVDTFQQAVGFDVIVLFTVQFDLPAPQASPIWVYFQKFVNVTDSAGIVLSNIFYIHQQMLGIDIVVIILNCLDKMIA